MQSLSRLIRCAFILVALALAACVDVIQVHQPSSGYEGQPFDVQVDVQGKLLDGACSAQFPCTAYVFASLPQDWHVQSCSYQGDASGSCTAIATDPNFLPVLPSIPAGNEWHQFESEPIVLDNNDRPLASVMLRIRPGSAGDYSLAYVLSGEHPDELGQPSGNQPITIQAATAIPTLSWAGLLILTLMFAGAGFFANRRQQR